MSRRNAPGRGGLRRLAGKNPAEFEKRLSAANGEIREEVLQDYAYRWGTAAEHDRLLARAAASPLGEAMALWRGLLSREAGGDPARAFATLKDLKLSDEDRLSLDEAIVSSCLPAPGPHGFHTEVMPGARTDVMLGWVERHPNELFPDSIAAALDAWRRDDPKAVATWVTGLPAGIRYDAFAHLLIKLQPEEPEKSAVLIGAISDPKLRTEMLRQVLAQWRKRRVPQRPNGRTAYRRPTGSD